MPKRFLPSDVAEQTSDIAFEDHGSSVLIRGLSDVGQAWLEENVGDGETQHFGNAIVAEPRYIRPIMEGAIQSGLVVRQ